MPNNTPKEEEKLEVRGSYETPVSFELMWKTILAWILRKNIAHRGILIVKTHDTK